MSVSANPFASPGQVDTPIDANPFTQQVEGASFSSPFLSGDVSSLDSEAQAQATATCTEARSRTERGMLVVIQRKYEH